MNQPFAGYGRGQYTPGFLGSVFGQELPPGMSYTGKPGEYFIEGVGVRKFADLRQDVLYDRVLVTPASIPAGAEFVYFRDIAGKTRLSTNMSQASVLPKGQEAVVYRINFMPCPEMTEADLGLIESYGYGEFVLDDDNIKRSGPITTFPSAYGMYGNTQTTVNASTVSVVSNGVPSPGANPRLLIPIYISEGRTFRFNVKFFEATVMAAAWYCFVILDVLIMRPVR